MVDPVDLQTFLHKIDGGVSAVDLCKIAAKHQQQENSCKTFISIFQFHEKLFQFLI